MRCILVAPLAVLLVCTVCGVWAQGLGQSIWEKAGPESSPVASWLGGTGLMAIPTAQVRPAQTAQVFYHWIKDGSTIGSDQEDLQVFGADAMVTKDVEVGVTRFQKVVVREVTDSTPSAQIEDKTTFNARVHLPIGTWTGNADAPEVAIGVRDASDEVNRAYYVVLSKGLHFRQEQGPYDLTVSLGYGHTRDEAGVLHGVFGGVDFTPGANFRIQAEYDAQEWNACVRFYPSRNLSLDLGTFNSNLAAGLTYESSW